MTGVADGVGARGARMRLVQTRAASGAVPAGLRAVMPAVRADRTLYAHGVAAAGAAANHAPAWTASAAVRAVPVMPEAVRLTFADLNKYSQYANNDRNCHRALRVNQLPAIIHYSSSYIFLCKAFPLRLHFFLF